MALVVADRVQETTSTTSTSDYVLLGAEAGYQPFNAVLADGDTTYYAVTNGTDWEVGIGTYSTTGPTLARTTILASSSGGSAVSWGVGDKNIFISYAASKSVYLDASGNLPVSDKIVHTGDTDTAVRFPAADTVSIETGGAERMRIGSAGQLGIGGANYGTSGQVLTSTGAGAAPAWTTPAAGGAGFEQTFMLMGG